MYPAYLCGPVTAGLDGIRLSEGSEERLLRSRHLSSCLLGQYFGLTISPRLPVSPSRPLQASQSLSM